MKTPFFTQRLLLAVVALIILRAFPSTAYSQGPPTFHGFARAHHEIAC